MKHFAIVLSGCGVYDGSEIHEAVMTMLAIDKNHCQYSIFAPDILQFHVINHLSGDEMAETRNVLVESARIARGKIESIDKLNVNDFDGIIFPGGFGAAKNLSTYAFKGIDCDVNSSIAEIIQNFHFAKKPIGGLCISPVLLSKVIPHCTVTIGDDVNTAHDIDGMGGTHIISKHGEAVVDSNNKIVTSACYMLEASIGQIFDDADAVVKAMIEIA